MEGLSWQLDQHLQSHLKPLLCKAQFEGDRSGLAEGGDTESVMQVQDPSCHEQQQQLLRQSAIHTAIRMHLSSLRQHSAPVKENIHTLLKITLRRYPFQSLFTAAIPMI